MRSFLLHTVALFLTWLGLVLPVLALAIPWPDLGPSKVPTPTPSRTTHSQLSNTHLERALSDTPVPDSLQTPELDLSPELPKIPNVFIPMTSHPERHQELLVVIPTGDQSHTAAPTRTPTFDSHHGSPYYSDPAAPGTSLDLEQLIHDCTVERAPSLPAAVLPEVGVVRLFAQASFRTEAVILKGCGCITLQSPLVIESFVGSRNHSFAFFSGRGCAGQPYFQRFKQHYDVEPNKVTWSVRIVQGVLPPVPTLTEHLDHS